MNLGSFAGYFHYDIPHGKRITRISSTLENQEQTNKEHIMSEYRRLPLYGYLQITHHWPQELILSSIVKGRVEQ